MGKRFNNKLWFTGLLLAVSLTGCGGDGGGASPSSVGSAKDSTAATRGAVSTEAAAVPLGTAGNYAILAKAGVDTVTGSVVTGNVGVSPIARVGLTGWGETYDVTDTYATSAQVVLGKLYAADLVGGTTKVDLTTAVGDMEAAYTAATAKPTTSAATTNVNSGNLGGLILAPAVYQFDGAVTIPTGLTLNGTATDVWVFKIAGGLNLTAAQNIILTGGALAKNVFWQVAEAVTIGATAHFEGIILGKTAITFGNKASINGRLLSQTAVVLDATTVSVP